MFQRTKNTKQKKNPTTNNIPITYGHWKKINKKTYHLNGEKETKQSRGGSRGQSNLVDASRKSLESQMKNNKKQKQ